MASVTVVGAGFAGVEAAWALAERGIPVRLIEMRPVRNTPAHTTSHFAELVCSNSLKSKAPNSPAGILKSEMDGLGSIVLKIARTCEVPAGQALGVDRDLFGVAITTAIEAHPRITVERREWGVSEMEEWLTHRTESDFLILATGPLTTPELANWLAEKTGKQNLYFYDAVSPTVEASSLDREIVFAQSRYDKGEGDDYLNCPFNKEEYEAFVRELVAAERAPIHAFEAGGVRTEPNSAPGYELSEGSHEEQFLETIKYFAGCTPIEAIAEKGARSLAFGNFKPVGLTDPRTGRRPWAALQLRPENKEKTLYSLVACQTRLKWGEQKRIFQMVPGLENAEFVRFGVIHRNTYVEAPTCLSSDLEFKNVPGCFLAGQLTGVEGYVESAAMGLFAGLAVAFRISGTELPQPPRATAYGSLCSHLQDQTEREFAPMNINWGLLPDPEPPMRDKGLKREWKVRAAGEAFAEWIEDVNVRIPLMSK